MTEESEYPRRHKARSKAHLVSKFTRYRLLLLKKWWIPVLGVLLGSGTAWVLSRLSPPAFTSVGRMIVSIKLAIPEGSVYSEEMSSFLGTQTALMQSAAVLQRARARLATADPALSPTVTLKVNVVPRTSIFVLQGTGPDPTYTAAFVQACMEEYIQLKREMRTQTSDSTVAGLTDEATRLEKELRRSTEELSAFQGTNSATLFEEQGNSAASYLNALNQRLAGMKTEYDLLKMLTVDQDLERQVATVGASPAGNDPADNSAPPATVPNSADTLAGDYLKARQELLLAKADLQDLEQYLRPKHPKVIAMKEEIARRERLLAIFRKQGGEQLENRKASLALQIENLQNDISEWTLKALDASRKNAEYQRLKGNSQRIQVLYDRLLATMQTLDVNKEASPESVTIMEKASPAYPDHPHLSTRLLRGALVGLGLAVGLLLVLDRLDDRMSSFTELQEYFDEEVLGQIPRERSPGKKQDVMLIQLDDERHSFVEAYRNLRSSLRYMAESDQRPKTILVTSSVPNDGKSITSANLAVTLASAGSRVLLVDADLRKGRLHHRFNLAPEPGLSEILSQNLNWEEAIQPSKFPNLFLLPRGTSTQRSSELFLNQATDRFLQNAAAKYDYVILDTAPVMAADDATSLAPSVDGVLFIIRAEQTSARVARAALELLYQRQARVLGLLFNAVRPTSGDYYYYYKYDDYYRSYPDAKTSRRQRKPEEQKPVES
jgi:capsular exopolysaccharide synthesis family protein